MTERRDSHKKRLRAKARAKLGTSDAELAAMTDAELLAAWTTDPNAPPEPTPKGSPMERWIKSLPDDELLALYEEATAETKAAEAERERRAGPKPEQTELVPVPVTEPPVEPHPVALSEPETPEPKPPLTPRQEWDAKQREIMREMMREGQEDGERRAEAMRRDSERPSAYDGPTFGSGE